jgi:hypothetical protein
MLRRTSVLSSTLLLPGVLGRWPDEDGGPCSTRTGSDPAGCSACRDLYVLLVCAASLTIVS